MRIGLAVGTWAPVGGSERYALDVAHELGLAGDEVIVLRAGGDAPPPPGGRVETYAPLEGLFAREEDHPPGAPEAALEALELEALFLVSSVAPWVARRLARVAPLVRFVQDHTFFCPGLNKRRTDGSICTRPAPWACLPRTLTGGCLDLPTGRVGLRRVAGRARELARRGSAVSLVVASGYMAGELTAAGIPADRVRVLPYFTREQPDPTTPLREDCARFLARQGERPMALCAARLVPEKGVEFLLEGVARVPGCCLVLAGDGPAREAIERAVQGHGLAERVHLTGWIDAPDLRALLRECRVSVMPSLWAEPFGIVGLEAMAAGRATIATAAGGALEWTAEGETGLLVPPGDIPAMVSALGRLTEDAALAKRMGSAGSQRVERLYRAPTHLAGLREVLESAANR
jgi:glycosyltransferase involved in cell wall biosynthesis